ncbi:MAG TPA: nuclear transport factor 2 family protein [Terriglobia bacterium]|nr:nuclear transport factor 2 family protein [Terriglobia bacterium]
MNSFRLRASLSVACLFAGLLAVRSPAARPAASDEEQIRAVLDAQVVAWNRGDVDAFMQGYWKTEKTEFVGANGVVRGWQAVLDRYRQAYPDREAMGRLTFSELEVTMLGSDAALVLGHFELERAHDHPRGVFTLVFRRFPEGWRIIHDHTSQVIGQPSRR